MGKLVGFAIFALEALLAIFFIYPAIFSFFKSLFDNNDIGTIVGLVACVALTGLMFWIAVIVAVLVGTIVETLVTDRNRKSYGSRR